MIKKTENKTVRPVSSQINMIFNLHAYLRFRYVFICLMMVVTGAETCSIIDKSNKVLLCSAATHSVILKTANGTVAPLDTVVDCQNAEGGILQRERRRTVCLVTLIQNNF